MTTHPGLPELRDWQLNRRLRYYAGRVHNHPRLRNGTLLSGYYKSIEVQPSYSFVIENLAGDQYLLLKADMTIYKEY